MSTPRVITIDEPRLRAVIVIDSLARGPAFGGVRRAVYADQAQALADAKQLAEAMTRKCALAELPAGGGKSVILDAPTLDRAAAYERFGEHVEALGGQYVCGPDIGTGVDELAAIRRATQWVNPLRARPRRVCSRVCVGSRGWCSATSSSAIDAM